ncbi:hypothetical protein [Chryseobacterium sp. T1]
MRKGIVYILMSIFLLFIAESKNYAYFQHTFGSHSSNSLTSKLAKKHYNTLSLEKSSSQHHDDSLDFPEELKTEALQYSNILQAVTLVSLLGLGYILNLLYLKRKKRFFIDITNISPSTRTFILFQSIRI